MSAFLIVNDDGADSPMLPPLVRRLGALGEVRVAVPRHEMSWKSKAMTRYGRVRAHRLEHLGCPAYAVEGMPADCVNLGVHNLFAGPPDWVVAGVNIGVNAGLNFLLNSGTVGAAFEAALLGLPAAAFSLYAPPHLYREWSETRAMSGPEAAHLVGAATERTAGMMDVLAGRGLPAGADCLNVNFPQHLEADTPARWTSVLPNGYGALFLAEGDAYRHAYRGDAWRADDETGDKRVVEAGAISVTPLTLGAFTAPVEEPFPL